MFNKSVLLIGLIVTSQLASVWTAGLQSGAASIINQLQDFQLDSEYGKQFIGLLQLRLEQGSHIDEVLSLIKQLLDQLRNDQQLDDLEHAQQMAEYATEIEQLQATLEQMTQDLSDTNTSIASLTTEIAALTSIINNLEAQLEILNGKEEEIRGVRANDEIAFKGRSAQSQRVLEALNTILETLTSAVFDEKDRQGVSLLETKREEILAKVHQKLGANHPISILLSVTTRFDIPTVERIIEKLETIRDGVVASQIDDENHEIEAIALFTTIIHEITEVREKLAQDYNENKQSHLSKSNEKIIAERTRDQLINDIPIEQQILQGTQEQEESYHTAFLGRSLQRGQEIEIIQSAYNLVNDHVSAGKRSEELAASLE